VPSRGTLIASLRISCSSSTEASALHREGGTIGALGPADERPRQRIECEWLARKRRIDPLLDAAGWPRRKAKASPAFRTEEEETAHGPADYALWLGDRVLGIVEAKKLTIGPQNVLTQAERYARGLHNGDDFRGPRVALGLRGEKPRQAGRPRR
jgi:hypothetical protein